MKQIAEQAHRIFELTALSEDDVVPETAAVVIAGELSKLGPLFASLLEDGWVHPDSVEKFENIVAAAASYSIALREDPRRILGSGDEAKPAYLLASDLCWQMIDIISRLDVAPQLRHTYDENCKRLNYFTHILQQNPDNVIKSV